MWSKRCRSKCFPKGTNRRDIFTFDTRFFRSLLPLFFRPGFLTKEWIAGRRSRYIPPLRLYVFISIMSFLFFRYYVVFRLAPELTETTIEKSVSSSDSTRVDSEIQDEKIYLIGFFGDKRPAIGNPFIANFSTTMFLMLPMFALILKGLYYRTGRFYVQHLILGLHVHAFSFLFIALLYAFMYMISFAFPGAKPGLQFTFPLVVFLMPLIYLYLSMKYVYGDSLGKTFARFAGLVGVYFVVFVFAFGGTAYLTTGF